MKKMLKDAQTIRSVNPYDPSFDMNIINKLQTRPDTILELNKEYPINQTQQLLKMLGNRPKHILNPAGKGSALGIDLKMRLDSPYPASPNNYVQCKTFNEYFKTLEKFSRFYKSIGGDEKIMKAFLFDMKKTTSCDEALEVYGKYLQYFIPCGYVPPMWVSNIYDQSMVRDEWTGVFDLVDDKICCTSDLLDKCQLESTPVYSPALEDVRTSQEYGVILSDFKSGLSLLEATITKDLTIV